MSKEKAYEMGATLARVADCTDRLTICTKKLTDSTAKLTDKIYVLQLAVMMLAQKAGVDGIELMEDAQRVYDVERLNHQIND